MTITSWAFALCCVPISLMWAEAQMTRNGTNLSGCRDGKGGFRNPGDEWTSRDSFVVRCVTHKWGWSEDVVACLTRKGQRIQVGSSSVEDGIEYQCVKNGKVTHLRAVGMIGGGSTNVVGGAQVAPAGSGNQGIWGINACFDAEGGQRGDGEEWVTRDGMFFRKCSPFEWGKKTETTACRSQDGSRIKIGETVVERDVTYQCRREGNTVHLKTTGRRGGVVDNWNKGRTVSPGVAVTRAPGRKSIGCFVSGLGQMEPGTERKVHDMFIVQCDSKGIGRVLACLIPGTETRVPINDSIVVGSRRWTCQGVAGGFDMRAQITSSHAGGPGPGPMVPWGRRETNCTPGETKERIPDSRGGFAYRCDSAAGGKLKWTTTHCIIPSGEKIVVGQTLTRGQDIFKCLTREDGRVKLRVEYMPKPGESVWPPVRSCEPGKTIEDLQSTGGFLNTCVKDSTGKANWVITHCITTEGERIKIGEELKKGGRTYVCSRRPNNGAKLRVLGIVSGGGSQAGGNQISGPATQIVGGRGNSGVVSPGWQTGSNGRNVFPALPPKNCFYRGGSYENGAEWRDGSFIRKCIIAPGEMSIDIVACVTYEGKRFAVDSTITEGKFWYECKNNGNHVGLRVEELHSWLASTKAPSSVVRAGNRNQATSSPGRARPIPRPDGNRPVIRSGLPRFPDAAGTFRGKFPAVTTTTEDPCEKSCLFDNRKLCNGDKEKIRDFQSGRSMVRCNNGELEGYCNVRTLDAGNDFEVDLGKYLVHGGNLLTCGYFLDNTFYEPANSAPDTAEWRKILKDSGYIRTQ